MKLLLCKNVSKLGIVGDVVNVAAGYGRNYLVPQGLATQPTDANVRALAEDRKVAEAERLRERELLNALAARLEDAEVTIRAAANEDGVLYGSVGAREIAEALVEEGYQVVIEQIRLDAPIRQLDNAIVTVKLADDLRCPVKVWVVREKSADDEDEAEEGTEESPSTEAGDHDDSTDE